MKRLESISRQVEDLRTDLGRLKALKQELTIDINDLKNQREQLYNYLQQILSEAKSKKKQIKDAEHIKSLVAQKEVKFTQKEKILAKREKDLEKKEKQARSLDKVIGRKERALDQVSGEQRKLKKSFEERKAYLFAQIKPLEERRKVLIEQILTLKNESDLENRRLKQAMNDVKELYQVAENKNQEVDRRAKKIENSLEQKKKELHSKIAKEEEDFKSEVKDMKQELRSDKLKFMDQSHKKERYLDEKESKLARLTMKLDEREHELNALAKEISRERYKILKNKVKHLFKRSLRMIRR